MKKRSMVTPALLVPALLLLPILVQAQDLQQNLDSLNAQRLHVNRVGMGVLGGWALVNIGFSGTLYFRTEGTVRGFHQMNVLWNFVNLGLAAGGWLGSAPGSAEGLSLAESVVQQQRVGKILLVNAGLDVAYVMTGFFLRERSRKPSLRHPERMMGWGNSLILQGGFLLVFDLGMVLLHHQHGSRGVMKVLETVQPVPGGLGLAFPIH